MLKALILLTLTLGGCASLDSGKNRSESESASQARHHHAIYVDQFGNIKQSASAEVVEPQKPLPDQAKDEERYVDAIIENYHRQNKAFRKQPLAKLQESKLASYRVRV